MLTSFAGQKPRHGMTERNGFTLIELSIVLVIIGLIVGGVLVGQDLIRAAQVRAQVAQMEKLNAAVNTFRDKYGGVPGDLSANLVAQFNFSVTPLRAGTAGQGDGDGIIQGYAYGQSQALGFVSQGETAWFWEDLTANTHLFEGYFTYAGTTVTPSLQATNISKILPAAKLGNAIYLYVYNNNNVNYYGLSAVYQLNLNGNFYAGGNSPGISIAQAFSIDKKIDDGLPQTGRVTATWEAWDIASVYPVWAQGAGVSGPSDTTALAGNSTTCFDNGGNAGVVQQYSLTQNKGNGSNCALSFRFQ